MRCIILIALMSLLSCTLQANSLTIRVSAVGEPDKFYWNIEFFDNGVIKKISLISAGTEAVIQETEVKESSTGYIVYHKSRSSDMKAEIVSDGSRILYNYEMIINATGNVIRGGFEYWIHPEFVEERKGSFVTRVFDYYNRNITESNGNIVQRGKDGAVIYADPQMVDFKIKIENGQQVIEYYPKPPVLPNPLYKLSKHYAFHADNWLINYLILPFELKFLFFL